MNNSPPNHTSFGHSRDVQCLQVNLNQIKPALLNLILDAADKKIHSSEVNIFLLTEPPTVRALNKLLNVPNDILHIYTFSFLSVCPPKLSQYPKISPNCPKSAKIGRICKKSAKIGPNCTTFAKIVKKSGKIAQKMDKFAQNLKKKISEMCCFNVINVI